MLLEMTRWLKRLNATTLHRMNLFTNSLQTDIQLHCWHFTAVYICLVVWFNCRGLWPFIPGEDEAPRNNRVVCGPLSKTLSLFRNLWFSCTCLYSPNFTSICPLLMLSTNLVILSHNNAKNRLTNSGFDSSATATVTSMCENMMRVYTKTLR